MTRRARSAPPPAAIRVPCFICGGAAILANETRAAIDIDCRRCGRLRVTGRAWFVFPPTAMQAFDRPWLSDKVRAIQPTPQDGNRRRIDELWLHHWRLVLLMRIDHKMSEPDALAHIARHPDTNLADESLLDLLR